MDGRGNGLKKDIFRRKENGHGIQNKRHGIDE